MSISTSLHNDSLYISIEGKFNASVQNLFLDSYENRTENIKQYIIDVGKTKLIDSAGIAMLLMLRSTAMINNPDSIFKIKNCAPKIKKVLKIAQIDSMFILE